MRLGPGGLVQSITIMDCGIPGQIFLGGTSYQTGNILRLLMTADFAIHLLGGVKEMKGI